MAKRGPKQAGTQTVQEQLLAKLFADPAFLRQGMSEENISQALGVSLSSAREEIIGQLAERHLDRGIRRVERPSLSTENIIAAHTLWLTMENMAALEIATSDRRLFVAADLAAVLSRQRKAAEGRDSTGWIKADLDFHAALMAKSPAEILGSHLNNTITRLRIGSGLIETEEQQKAVMELNEKLVRMLSHGSKDDVACAIEERVELSFGASLEALGIPYDERLWNACRHRVAGADKGVG